MTSDCQGRYPPGGPPGTKDSLPYDLQPGVYLHRASRRQVTIWCRRVDISRSEQIMERFGLGDRINFESRTLGFRLLVHLCNLAWSGG
jgi:hypothetical protein